jgi:hypothetical protein
VEAESHLNIEGLVTEGLEGTTAVDFTFAKGLVECREAAIPRLRKLLVWRAAAGEPSSQQPVVNEGLP